MNCKNINTKKIFYAILTVCYRNIWNSSITMHLFIMQY
uniref:Uncharacterized protein n=1 Tax=Anguilla anguilla TaxID=7936 RepID=A0A0E9UFQ8_ANGAN